MGLEEADPLGSFIREQRQLARLSLREMAKMTRVSNAYLSQIERGLHAPSMRVMRAVADALDIPVEELVDRSGGIDADAPTPPSRGERPTLEQAIRQDPRLDATQKEAMLSVLRGFVGPEAPSD